MTGVLVISNLDVGDDTFDSDVGSWNVSRAKRDCAAGMHKLYTFDVAATLANNANVDVDPKKIAAMVADRERLEKSSPPIFIMENDKLWLIDGHHRIRALAVLGQAQFAAYVIEDDVASPYRVYFNGERVSPWMKR